MRSRFTHQIAAVPIAIAFLAAAACTSGSATATPPPPAMTSAVTVAPGSSSIASGSQSPNVAATAVAIFSGGCFWCEETAFEGVEGVLSVTSGYTGGSKVNPTYEEVSSGTTGHAESVQVVYDHVKIGYPRLLEIFWHNIDPLDGGGQFCDRGSQYRSGIHTLNDEQRRQAEASKAELEADPLFKGKIATEIVPATPFYPAEEYHQDFYKKSPVRYQSYRYGCGRDQRLRELWGEPATTPHAAAVDSLSSAAPAAPSATPAAPSATPAAPAARDEFRKPTDEELKARLTPLQYEVTQREGTEFAFRNEYWDKHAPGIYVDVVSGEPLFSSLDKYESGTGWPSFTKPLEPANIKTGTDTKLGYSRSEIRSVHADSHLGHVFDDGPAPTGLRYCMNSAAMRFIPAAELEAKGYGEYLRLFPNAKN